MVLLKGADVVLSDPVVNVESFRDSVDVVRLFAEKVDDSSPVGTTPRTCQNVP